MKTQMTSSKKNLEMTIARLTKKVDEFKSRLNSNPVFEIPWVTEPLFRTALELDYFKAAMNDINDGTEEGNVYQHYIKVCAAYTSKSYNVMESSTSLMHRDASIWRYQVIMDLQERFKEMYNNLNN